MRVQTLLGSDVAMAFDECPPGAAERPVIERAMRRTTDWAKRCLRAPWREGQARFGIVQGATHVDLRRLHLDEIAGLEEDGRSFDGVALGGFSVGEPIPAMHEALGEIAPHMPTDRPRYLMGVGTPLDLLVGIGAGIDLFDCVLPTRNARNGQALTWGGRVNLKQARHKDDEAPLDARCACITCKRWSRAYLHHLVRADEMLGARLVTHHNLFFYGALCAGARSAIREGRYSAYAAETALAMKDGDEVKTGARSEKRRGPKTKKPKPARPAAEVTEPGETET